MVKYFDNIIFWLQRAGGGSVYWGELMQRFNKQEDSLFIEPTKKNCSNMVRSGFEPNKIIYENAKPISLLRYIPVNVKIENGAIFHSSYYRYCAQKEVINFVTVHDFVYERFTTGIKKFIHHKQKSIAVDKAKAIVCISENTKKDLLHFIPSAKNKKIKVIYNGVAADYYKLSTLQINQYAQSGLFSQKKMVLYIGHRTAYKNFAFAVETVSHLPGDYCLLIVGNRLTEQEKNLLDKKLPEKYIFMGNVDNTALNFIYNLAHCLLYPSTYEGFGIPIAEAMKCGCPVVALDASSIPEVAGNAALLCNDLSIGKFKQNILSLNSDDTRKPLAEAGFEQSAQFSWDKCFDELNDFYDSVK